MIKNYFKVAVRFLLRYKGYTAINIIGLAVGVTCCLLIMLFVRSEFSYDKFNAKANRIYRVWQYEKADGREFINTVTPLPLAGALKSTYPEVESSCRVFVFNTLLKYGNNSFSENVTMVDSSLFSIFDFKLLKGDINNPFPSQNTIILSSATAKKYFGNNDALGKSIELQVGQNKVPFTVSGIAEEAPEESSIKYDMLISYSNARYLFRPRMFTNWFNVFNETYVLLRSNVNVSLLEKKLPGMLKLQLGADYGSEQYDIHLQPLTKIHLDTSLPGGNQPVSNPKYAYILSTIGVLILLVACINFITLSVGRSTTRALEVGVRKAMGAERTQLIKQFWGEALLVTLLAVALGLVLSAALLKPFNTLIDRNLVIHFDFVFILFCVLLAAVIALIAGIYPAVILSGFSPVEVLKGKLNLKANAGLFRKGLIVGQFAVSIIMLTGTIIISKQMSYIQTTDIGYNKEHVIIVPTNKPRDEGFRVALLYKAELLKHPEVDDVTTSVFSLAENKWATLGYADEKKAYHSFQFNQVQPGFTQAMRITMAQGRSFTEGNTADYNNSIIVNEALVKGYGLINPVGQKFGIYSQRIVGVMKDFNYESLHEEIKPLVLALNGDTIMRQSQDVSFALSPQPRISIRMKPGNLTTEVNILRQAWQKVSPSQDFEYHFLDESLAEAYKDEQKSSTIVKIASSLSVLIACLGLFGLATLTVARRTKEIGIRKVLGANVGQIISLVSKEFVVLVIAAALIAFPVAWWAMHNWLLSFAYRTGISWWVFAVAGIVCVLIALITVGIQAIKAAVANPVKSLRVE
jgi:putative ABC transport system permease protein